MSNSISSTGLVFAIDTANTQKSYKGGPVTNSQWNSGTEFTPWGYPDAIITDVSSTPEAGPIIGAKTWRFQHTGVNTAPFVSQWTGWEQMYTMFTGAANDIWTCSYWYKCNKIGDTGAILTQGMFYVNDWSRAHDCTILSNTNTIIADGKWHFNSVTTRINEAYTNAIIVDGPSWSSSGANTGILYINGLQWNKNAYPAQFAQGSRANTEVFYDITGKTSITANSLTYGYDGAPSFNGSSDYVSMPITNLTPQYVTFEAWYKHTNSGQSTSFIGGVGNTGSFGYWMGRNNGSLMFSVGNGTANSRAQSVQGVNTMYHAVGTYDGVTTTLYVNGVAVSAAFASAGPIDYAAVTTGYIGQLTNLSGTRYWTGQIPFVRIYNRALTAAEVMQNFIAQRTRFGV
jgi:hypothetical protein